MRTALDKIVDPEQRAAMTRQAEKIIRDAVRLQGARAVESTRRIAAIHEAGHAIVYEATADGVRWWPPYRLKIWRLPVPGGLTFWAGSTDTSPKAPPESVDTRNDPAATAILALRAMAGYVAERLFCREDFRQASSVDEMLIAGGCARGLSGHWHREPEEVLTTLIVGTGRILKANEAALWCVARRLEQARKLENGELRRLLAGCGNASRTAPEARGAALSTHPEGESRARPTRQPETAGFDDFEAWQP